MQIHLGKGQRIIVAVVVALVSMFLLTKLSLLPAITNYSVSYLDSQRTTVTELSAASLASSAALTFIPGDVGTPIANKLADLSMYTVIVMCALLLEKYLVSITGILAFRILIPLACIIYIAYEAYFHNPGMMSIAKRLVALGLVLYALIPASVFVTKTIDNIYKTSIQETIQEANQQSEEIESQANNNVIDQFVNGLKNGISGLTNRFQTTLNKLIEAFAILIVTSCLISIMILVLMIWVVKMFLQLDIRMPKDISFNNPLRRKGSA